jgi:enterochelin esterase-like enzyme
MKGAAYGLVFLWVLTACERREAHVDRARKVVETAGATSMSGPARPHVTATGKTQSASAGEPRLRRSIEEFTWTFQDESFGRLDVVVVLPDRLPEQRFPVLIALHGRGEAMKGPERGARGWVDDYSLLRAAKRLADPPLVERDFEGFVTEERLKTLNSALARQPYEGLIVLCPYTPDVLAGERPFERVKPFARFLTDVLLPRVKKELPVIGTVASTGLDGVSLGGRVAILSGLYAPEQVQVIGGLQAAFDSKDAPRLGALGDEALRRNPKLRFRFLTSDRDYFLDANQALALEFQVRKIPSRLRVVPGPHDYAFNRGPGAIEMLFFHDRALRGPQWPE